MHEVKAPASVPESQLEPHEVYPMNSASKLDAIANVTVLWLFDVESKR